MQTGNTDFIYRNELDKACYQHDMAYGRPRHLAKRTQKDKILRDKAFKVASNREYDGYQRGLASMVYNFFDKKSTGSGAAVLLANKSATKPNYQLPNELHRQILRKFKKTKFYSPDNIFCVDLADMQSLSRCNKGISSFYCVQLICLVNMRDLFL